MKTNKDTIVEPVVLFAMRRSDKHRAVKSARVYRKNSCDEEYEC